MTIYNINFAIGKASSGVEYAQLYRARMLRETGYSFKFVFLELILSENIQTYTSNMGFKDDEIISLYNYFTDIKIHPTTFTLEDLKATIRNPIVKEERQGNLIYLILAGNNNYIRCYPSQDNPNTIDHAEFVMNNNLIRKDYYTYVRTFSEYYTPEDNKAKLYLRKFYNEDGSTAFQEFINDEQHTFSIHGYLLDSWQAFIGYFIRSLNLESDDVLILDRASKIGQTVLENRGDAKVGVVVHAEHYSANTTDDQYILWNNYYDYQFMNRDAVDFYITATERQKEVLMNHFEHYYDAHPLIFAIPVGNLEQLKYPTGSRKPYSIITASRLASEKHIDWMIEAVVLAKNHIPELSFDIYGEGNKKSEFQQRIEGHNAQDYIKLKGHVHLDEVYKDYQLFLAASTSEGFGLTLMEAVGSGLGMIGFDVDYGNTTFIADGVNGYRVPIDIESQDTQKYAESLAEAIIKFFAYDSDRYHEASYKIAEAFTSRNVLRKWQDLLEEVQHD